MIRLRHYLLIIMLTIGHLILPDSAYPIDNGTWTHYTRQAPTTDIKTMHTLADGSMWVSTGRALHEFVGVQWHRHLFSSDRFSESAPFFADSSGVFYYYFRHPETIVTVDFTGGTEQINDYYLDPDISLYPVIGAVEGSNGIYIFSKNETNGGNGGIYRFHDGTLDLIRAGKTNSITFDHDGRLWAVHQEVGVSNYSLMIFDNNIWTDVSDNVPSVTYSTVVATAPDGAVWINNEGRHTIHHDGVWDYYDGGENNPYHIAFGPDGSVWGLRLNSIYQRSDAGVWELSCWFGNYNTYKSPYFFTSIPGYPRCISNGHTVYRYDETVLNPTNKYPWSPLPNPYDLGSDMITSLAYTWNGLLLCGHGDPYTDVETWENAGLSIFDGQRWYNSTVTTNDDIRYQYDNVFALKTLDNGGVMVSSDSGYSLFFDGEGWSYIDSLVYKDTWEITRTATDYGEDEDDNLWVATKRGLVEHDYIDDSVIHYPSDDDEIGYMYSNIFIDNGMIYLKNTSPYMQIVSYDSYKDTWSIHADLSGVNVRDFIVYDRHSSEPWIMAAMYDGLYWSREDLDREQVKSQDTGDDISLPYASMVSLDLEGNIWASGFNNTGYIDENGNWNRIEALQNMQASAIAYDFIENQYALNSVTIETVYEEEIFSYDGLYIFTADGTGIKDNKPSAYPLSTNYPNPFNASTTISFVLPISERTVIGIYSTTGQLIRTLDDRRLPAGRNTIVWDARDDNGDPVASGLYIYRIIAGPATMTGKMLLLK